MREHLTEYSTNAIIACSRRGTELPGPSSKMMTTTGPASMIARQPLSIAAPERVKSWRAWRAVGVMNFLRATTAKRVPAMRKTMMGTEFALPLARATRSRAVPEPSAPMRAERRSAFASQALLVSTAQPALRASKMTTVTETVAHAPMPHRSMPHLGVESRWCFPI